MAHFKRFDYKKGLKELLKEAKKQNKKIDKKLIEKAYDYSAKFHKGQSRISGEEFFCHPYACAIMLAQHGLDAKTIAAALLHDALEDTALTPEKLKKEFGKDVYSIVESLTKLKFLAEKKESAYRTDNIRKLLAASAKDLRVVIIKLCDRLHNLETLSCLPKNKRQVVAVEALEVYAPVAHKLGLHDIEHRMEDIGFSVLWPNAFKAMKSKIKKLSEKKKKEIALMEKRLKKAFEKEKIKVLFERKERHPYGVFEKINASNKSLEELHDFVILILVVPSIKECYEALGVLHKLFKPIPKKLKDHIAIPSSEFYRSIHTTVIGPKGKPVKVYVRTKEMHEEITGGVLNQLKKKESPAKIREKILMIESLLELDKKGITGNEFMKALRTDLLQDYIFVFSPKGEMFRLPKGSTPIDYAFAVHSDLGKRAFKAIVNNRIVPLWHILSSGDIVEIIQSKNLTMKKEWLSFVRSQKARGEIKKSLKFVGEKEEKKGAEIASISVVGRDRIGWLNEVTGVLSGAKLNIISANIQTNRTRTIAEDLFVVEYSSKNQIEKAIKKLKSSPRIIKAEASYLK